MCKNKSSSQPIDVAPVALLIIDMQPPLIQAMPSPEDLLKRCSFAIEVACLLNLCVLFTEQNPKKLQATHSTLRSLVPQALVFPKLAFSAIRAPGLSEFLQENNIKHLIVAGVETPICIYQTVLDAQKNALAVTLLDDCISCRRTQDAHCTLRALSQAGAHILPSETVFYSILGSADHPHFPAFNQIVKKYS